jgi:hypothetical protein
VSDLLAYEWEGDAMRPLPRFRAEADKVFVIGEHYLMEAVQQRSEESHRHYFAAIREGWMNLPENIADQYPNPEVLRKHALIRTGFCDSHQLVCSSKAEAHRLAAFTRPIDAYSIVTVSGPVVTRYVAHSQKKNAMGAETFQASKTAALDHISGLIGTTSKALEASNAA